MKAHPEADAAQQKAAHSPAPWRWGKDMESESKEHVSEREKYDGPKYADVGLYDANDRAIMPLRVDHHDLIWDGYLSAFKEADRDLILAAPETAAELERVKGLNRELVEKLGQTTHELGELIKDERDDPSVGIVGWNSLHQLVGEARAVLAKATQP